MRVATGWRRLDGAWLGRLRGLAGGLRSLGVAVSGLGSGNSHGVSLRVALFGDGECLGRVPRSWSAGRNVDILGDGLGHRRRAVLRDGNSRRLGRWLRLGSSGRVDRDIGSSGRVDWGVGDTAGGLGWRRDNGSRARLATAAVDGGSQSLGDVRGSQVCGVDGGSAIVSNRGGARHPSVGCRRDRGSDINGRLRL